MASYTIQRLKLKALTDEVLGDLSDMHVKAFVDDPSTEIMVEYNPQISDLRWRAAIRATALEGELWVLTVVDNEGEKKEIASCAGWFSPGNFLFGTEEQRALGYEEYLSRITPATKDWMKNVYSPQVNKVMKATIKPEDHKHLWWVSSLATHPSHQGRGYATVLMDVLIQKVGKKMGSKEFLGLAASPDNVPFYKSLGFKVDGSGEISTPKGNQSVHFAILTKFRS